ncbi:MAG: DUF971 domain-containing protein [Gemmatimonadetes bacterium]|nr:DUF971 domain-containing protein [Gemmatimonadota bacterium]
MPPPSRGHPPLRLARWAPYGLRVEWSDGHGTRIYTFRWLRDRCPCEACTAGAVPVVAP